MDHEAGLRTVLGPSASLITDPEITLSYSKDQAPFAAHQAAAIVLLAKSTEEVAKAVSYANTHTQMCITFRLFHEEQEVVFQEALTQHHLHL